MHVTSKLLSGLKWYSGQRAKPKDYSECVLSVDWDHAEDKAWITHYIISAIGQDLDEDRGAKDWVEFQGIWVSHQQYSRVASFPGYGRSLKWWYNVLLSILTLLCWKDSCKTLEKVTHEPHNLSSTQYNCGQEILVALCTLAHYGGVVVVLRYPESFGLRLSRIQLPLLIDVFFFLSMKQVCAVDTQ